MAKKVDSDQAKIVVKTPKKKWKNPNNLKAEYCNDMTVNHTEQEFFLSFFLTEPPLAFDEEDLKIINEIDALLVAKVAVTPEFAKRIRKALDDNIKTFEETMIKGKGK